MSVQSKMTLAAFLLIVTAIVVSTSASAKPPFCDWSCSSEYPDSYCTCEFGTAFYGTVLTCGEYFEGFCDDLYGGLGGVCSTPMGDDVSREGDEPGQLRQNEDRPAGALSTGETMAAVPTAIDSTAR